VSLDTDLCDDSLQRDSVAAALDAAREGWAIDRDPRALRRALAKLLGELE
jgi:hypothetical protein